jgi:squalene-associated FAD-dependent desaturase
MRAVVVGGGLAGLAAALELADAGHDLTLVEARPTLGGAVQTLPARAGDPDPPPDNGQHIALGCFVEYCRFLERIGKRTALRRERLRLPVIAEDGSVGYLGGGVRGLLGYRQLTLAERVQVLRVVRRLEGESEADNANKTFGELLRKLGQSERVIERFWDVFVRPALNLPTDEAGANYGLHLVSTALLSKQRGWSDVLLPAEPLGSMHGDAAGVALRRLGAELRLGERVAELDGRGVLLEGGERIEADAIVVAVPPEESARLLGEPDPKLGASPIVSVHLLFDRPVLRHLVAGLLASPAHWVFDRGLLTGHAPAQGQYLTVVSSGAPELLAIRGRELVEVIAGALADRLGPAELLWSRVCREPRATFAARPGTLRRRPGAETAWPNVVRAGAFTATGWPATMESAVASGRRAAGLLANMTTKVAA